MNEEKALVLFDAVTGVREDYLAEAEKFSRHPRRKLIAAVAACFLLIAGFAACYMTFGAPAFPGRFVVGPGAASGTGGGGGEGDSYMRYAGPVFPLAALEAEEDLTLERCVTFDYASYAAASVPRDRRRIGLTDEYLLTNMGESRSFELYYPFAFDGEDGQRPTVEVEGATAETELIVGPFTDAEGEFPAITSWKGYRSLLGEDYLRRALEPAPGLDVPVIVYELSDRWGKRTKEAPNPTLCLEFTLSEERTAVLTYGFNGGSNDHETGRFTRHASVPREGAADFGRSAYMLVLGEDVGDPELRTYADGGCEVPFADAGCTLKRYASTLGEMLTLFEGLHSDAAEAPEEAEELPGGARAVDLIGRRYGELGILEGDYARFWTSFSQWGVEEDLGDLGRQRVLYLRFTVTIPAGESVRVRVTASKRPSYDFYGHGKDRDGCDLVTRLGSPLSFTKQEAALAGAEHVDILDQDFGFDPEKGVLRVTLDPKKERYYLDVLPKED